MRRAKAYLTSTRRSSQALPLIMSSSSASSSSSTLPLYTGPELPIILPEEEYDSRRPSIGRAFLSKTPAPGSSIEVRTHPHEYQIWVILPGFTWDGITLATQKRRVLHIVADKWGANEGESTWTFIVYLVM